MYIFIFAASLPISFYTMISMEYSKLKDHSFQSKCKFQIGNHQANHDNSRTEEFSLTCNSLAGYTKHDLSEPSKSPVECSTTTKKKLVMPYLAQIQYYRFDKVMYTPAILDLIWSSPNARKVMD